MTNFELWGDSLLESDWFKTLNSALFGCKAHKIGPRGKNPKHIEKLVLYDRPDIILCRKDRPILVLEKTREVPTGHNIGQRLGRVVRALECSTPVLTVIPFRARKHGTHTSICEINPRVLRSAIKMGNLHDTPCLFLDWQTDIQGELIGDGSSAKGLKNVVDSALKANCNLKNFEVKKVLSTMETCADKLEKDYPPYLKPPGSVTFETIPATIEHSKHRRFCVYKINMSKNACRREDPYTGMQFLYDYLYCRHGTLVHEKSVALVLSFPNLTRHDFETSNPNNPHRKSCLWYATANELWFSDQRVVLR